MNAENRAEQQNRALHRAVDAIDSLHLFVDSYGLVAAGGQTELIDKLRESKSTKYGKMAPDVYRKVREHTWKVEQFATTQGMSYLFGFSAVQLWSILEAATDDVARAALADRSSWATNATTRSLKVALADFVVLTHEQQVDLLLDHYKFAVKAAQQVGVSRFEAVLDGIGLGGGVDGDVRDVLFEMGQVRNVIVHQNGVADNRFFRECPWFGAQVGERLRFEGWHFYRYHAAVVWYIQALNMRLNSSEDPGADQRVLDTYLQMIRTAGVKAPLPKSSSHRRDSGLV